MLRGLLVLISLAVEPSSDREPIAARVQALVVAPLAAGVAGELSLLLLESPERSLPLALRLDSDAVALVENRLGWSAVVDPQALQPRLRAPFRAPSEPGVYVVRASIDYQICAGEWCRQKRGEIEWTVEVVNAP